MSLAIVRIAKNGDAAKEYILLKAVESVNVNNYALIDRTFDQAGNVSNIYRHFYRFPLQQVKEGEYVALRTSKGTYKYDQLPDGSPIHRFYWGSDAPIWNDDNVESAELLKVETSSKKSAGHPTKKKPMFKFKHNGPK